MSTLPLFDTHANGPAEQLDQGTFLLHGYALPAEHELLRDIAAVASAAPFRRMETPGGFTMSVEMTNCGALGWISDRQGYRYATLDPLSRQPWPAMPASIANLATQAAALAGFANFTADACLINRYAPGTRLTLHQDKNERDLEQPIVSVSLGIPATFQFGGLKRADKTRRIPLSHGDVLVWGGPDRLRYHGVLALKEAHHPLLGSHRINLTLRKAA